MITYETLHEKLLNKVINEEITIKEAADVENLYFSESVNTDDLVGFGLLVASIGTIITAFILKKKGDANFEKNLKKFPEIAEKFEVLRKERDKADNLHSKYKKLYDRATVIIKDYEEIRETVGAPKIVITEYDTVAEQVYDNINGWHTIYRQIHRQHTEQNRNYDPSKAKRVNNMLNELEGVLHEIDKTINELRATYEGLRQATNAYISVLRKSEKKVASEKNQLKLSKVDNKIDIADIDKKLKELDKCEKIISALLTAAEKNSNF